MLREFLYTRLFSLNSFEFFVYQGIGIVLLCLVLAFLFLAIKKRILPYLVDRHAISEIEQLKFLSFLKILLALILILFLLWILKLDYNFFQGKNQSFSATLIFEALIIIQLARVIDWLVKHIFIHKNYIKRDLEASTKDQSKSNDAEASANRIVQYIVYVLAIIFILRNFGIDKTLFTYNFSDSSTFDLKITNIFIAILIILVGRLIIWVFTQLALYGYYRRNGVDKGTQYAINQLISYVIYFFVSFFALEALGVKMTLIWGGAAALLVGVGLGLQQTFNDFFSGIVLLFERTVVVGDVINVNGTVGTVKRIGLRSSRLEARDSITLIVPNSKLVNENITNWSHFDDKVRFDLTVTVAYGTDPAKVKKILMSVANENSFIKDYPPPFVRFTEFGDHALVFNLYFFSNNYIIIEDVKSDLRFILSQIFKEENIVIPFPQRDVWIRKEP